MSRPTGLEGVGGLAGLALRRDRVRLTVWVLALTAVIWHNDHTGQPVRRSLLAYDH